SLVHLPSIIIPVAIIPLIYLFNLSCYLQLLWLSLRVRSHFICHLTFIIYQQGLIRAINILGRPQQIALTMFNV
ncbi:MAG: hypothetical protein ACRC8K_18365, partial [Waterburya sp.]